MQFRLIENAPIFHVALPDPIIAECEKWKAACDDIRAHPLGAYKLHDNAGSKHNAFQLSVPSQLVISSFRLAYTLRLCGEIAKCDHREFALRSWPGHFDGYDVWINYSIMGSSNPPHVHGGYFSGVIYLCNHGGITEFPDCNAKFSGTRGDMILFSSRLKHRVDVQQEDYERITFAFNIERHSLPADGGNAA